MRGFRVGMVVVVCAACGADPVYLMQEEYYGDSVAQQYVGGSCESVGNGGSGGTGAGGVGMPSYSVKQTAQDDGVHVVVSGPGGQVLAERLYGTAFLLSGRVDEFVVSLPQDHRLRLRYWGGTKCQPPRVPDGG